MLIHKDIIAFWEKAGYTVYPTTIAGVDLWFAKKPDYSTHIATRIDDKIKYYYDYVEYSENEFLRLIKLKAFL